VSSTKRTGTGKPAERRIKVPLGVSCGAGGKSNEMHILLIQTQESSFDLPNIKCQKK